jgi:hypothetical protein
VRTGTPQPRNPANSRTKTNEIGTKTNKNEQKRTKANENGTKMEQNRTAQSCSDFACSRTDFSALTKRFHFLLLRKSPYAGATGGYKHTQRPRHNTKNLR